MKTFRCKLVRLSPEGGFVETIDYIGPFESIPAGWCIKFRRAA